jgi:hypothetical protein
MPTHPPKTEISYEKRIAIVVLRLFCGWTFPQIADKLALRTRSVADIYARALKRTESGLQDSFVDVVRNVRVAQRSGRPPRIPLNSQASQQLRQLFHEHFELPIEVVTNYIAGLKIARSTAERVARDHRDPLNPWPLVRVVQPSKPSLPADVRDLRIEYAEWAI